MTAITDWGQAFLTAISNAFSKLFGFLPDLIGALLILWTGWFVAGWLAKLVANVLRKVRFNEAANRAGLSRFIQSAGVRQDASGVMAEIVKWFFRLIALVAAFSVLQLPALTAAPAGQCSPPRLSWADMRGRLICLFLFAVVLHAQAPAVSDDSLLRLNDAFTRLAGSLAPGAQSFPVQSIRCEGGSSVIPSHQTSPSSVNATLVKMQFSFSVSMALGLDFMDVPGATPKKPASGLMALSAPSGPGLIQAMSSPTVKTFQPSNPLGGTSMDKLVFPQALGNAPAT